MDERKTPSLAENRKDVPLGRGEYPEQRVVTGAIDRGGSNRDDRKGLLEEHRQLLRAALRPTVVRDRIGALRFGDRPPLHRGARHRLARDEEEALEPVPRRRRRPEHPLGPADVHLVELPRRSRVREPGGVDDPVRTLHRRFQALRVAELEARDLDGLSIQPSRRGGGAEQAAHARALAEELVDDVASDKAGGPRDDGERPAHRPRRRS